MTVAGFKPVKMKPPSTQKGTSKKYHLFFKTIEILDNEYERPPEHKQIVRDKLVALTKGNPPPGYKFVKGELRREGTQKRKKDIINMDQEGTEHHNLVIERFFQETVNLKGKKVGVGRTSKVETFSKLMKGQKEDALRSFVFSQKGSMLAKTILFADLSLSKIDYEFSDGKIVNIPNLQMCSDGFYRIVAKPSEFPPKTFDPNISEEE